MKRRDFLKFAGAAGAGSALSLLPAMKLYANHDGYTGPLWLTVEARGGWDPTSLCDPKGNQPLDRGSNRPPSPVNRYDAAQIGNAGNILYAPPPPIYQSGGALFDANIYTAAQFFNATHNGVPNYQRMLVLNGIHHKTNSHSAGQQNSWSGELGRPGYPNFSALVAGTVGSGRGIPFITNGGYDSTGGLVAPTRLNNNGIRALYEIAYPERATPNSGTSRLYFDSGTESLLRTAINNRHQRLLAAQNLTRLQNAISDLVAARQDPGHLRDLTTLLETVQDLDLNTFFSGRRRARDLYRQGRVALAAYESGVTASAHIVIGGYDTHGDHDERHHPRLMDMLLGVEGIIQQAYDRGLEDRLFIFIGSDFGRTNRYNDGNGKDHWAVTSAMFWAAPSFFTGNRVVGQTDAYHNTVRLNTGTLQPDANGVQLQCYHVHHALRNLAGVNAPPEFRLNANAAVDNLQIFT